MIDSKDNQPIIGKIEALFRSMHDLLVIFDETGRILMVNPFIEKTLQQPFELLLTRTIHDLRPPDLREQSVEALDSINRGETFHYDLPFITAAGTIVHVEGRVSDTMWGHQKLFFGIFRDITEKRESERIVKGVAKRDRLAARILNRLVNFASADLDQELVSNLKTLGRFNKAGHAFFLLCHEDQTTPETFFEWSASSQNKLTESISDHEMQWLLEKATYDEPTIVAAHEMQWLNSAKKDGPATPDNPEPSKNQKSFLQAFGQPLIIVPIRIRKKARGIIGLSDLKIDLEDTLSQRDIRLLKLTGETFVIVADNVRHRKALEESRKRLALSLQATQCAVWDLNWETKVVRLGPLHRQILGVSLEEKWIPEKPLDQWLELMHPADKATCMQKLTEFVDGKFDKYKTEFRIMNQAGSWVWIESSARVIEYEGKKQELHIVGTHIDITQRKKSNIQLQSKGTGPAEDTSFHGIIGQSLPMQQIFDAITLASSSDANVIIYGESGTGKELVANAIHARSDRKRERLVAVNCGAISPTVVESEFFGYKKGAFTGANTDKAGYLDSAHNATLFLDELGELPLSMQVKLLRALDGGGYTPVGGTEVKFSNARIIAATNRNLKEMVKAGDMREDFFYRIHIIPIYLPPLRSRKGDVDLLIDHFLAKFNKERKQTKTIPEDVVEKMRRYRWPGNVREMQNTINRYLTLGEINFLESGSYLEPPDQITNTAIDFKGAVEEFERKLIIKALRQCNGNKSKAAEIMNLPRRSLHRKIDAYQIELRTEAF